MAEKADPSEVMLDAINRYCIACENIAILHSSLYKTEAVELNKRAMESIKQEQAERYRRAFYELVSQTPRGFFERL